MKNSNEKNKKEIAEVYKNHNKEEIFNHIGRKTKNLARFLAVFNSMLCIVAGVLTIGFSAKYDFVWGVPIGIFVIIVGCIMSFLMTFTMYAIGEVAVLAYDTNTYVKKIEESLEEE